MRTRKKGDVTEDDPKVGITALKAAERGAVAEPEDEKNSEAPEPAVPATEDLLTLSG